MILVSYTKCDLFSMPLFVSLALIGFDDLALMAWKSCDALPLTFKTFLDTQATFHHSNCDS